MDKKKLVLLIGALVVAIGSALMVRSMFAGAGAPQAEAAPAVKEGPRVLVAQRALPLGTIITADALQFQEWPEELVQNAYFIDGETDLNALLGTVVRYPITAGEPVTQGVLVSPGDRGFLAAALSPGMRAVTVPVSAKTAVAGFVFPGDRVDLMLTQTVSNEDGQTLKATETIIRNLRVLATDKNTEQLTKEGKTVVRTFRNITFEVTPRIAEKLSVAQTLGTLSLSLRSIADSEADLEKAIASGTVVVPEGASPDEEERLLRQAASQPSDGRTTYSTGADVSRFEQLNRRRRPEAAQGSAPATVAQAPKGPVIRVTRGNNTQEVPVSRNGSVVGGERQQNAFEQMMDAALRSQARQMEQAGATVGASTGATVR